MGKDLPFDIHVENNQKLYEQLYSMYTLGAAFKRVEANKGAPGIDGVTIEKFKVKLEENLWQLKEELATWKYKPKPVRAVEIPKPGGGTRQLGVPCVRDRVVQTALDLLLQPILNPLFSESSYGFRPGRNQKQAVEAAQRIIQSGKEYVVDIDLAKFFDTINHDRLIHRLSERVADKRIARIIGMTLRSGIMKGGLVTPSREGATQGSPLSPLLSNLVLDELDKELEKRGLEFCRFADDGNIFARSKKAAERIMENVTKYIENKLKLKVNKEKSKVALSKTVKFLGMTIIAGTIAISAASMKRAMAKARELTPRGTHLQIEESIKEINRWYMGWSGYYRMTQYPSQLQAIEAHIRRRLRARIVKQQKKRRNLCNKLEKMGIPKGQASKTAYSNKGVWALSRTRAMERAYSNNWFIKEKKLKIRSNEQHEEWFEVDKWIKLT